MFKTFRNIPKLPGGLLFSGLDDFLGLSERRGFPRALEKYGKKEKKEVKAE